VGRADTQAGGSEELAVAAGKAGRGGAALPAAVADGHRHARIGGRQLGGRLAGGKIAAQLGQAWVIVEPDAGVGVVEEAVELRGPLRAFDQAAEGHHGLEAAVALEILDLAQHAGRFLAGVVDESAGVDQADVGVGRAFGDEEAGADQLAEDALGVDGILGAAQADQAGDRLFLG
jgi:hypothetical protein